MKRCQSCGRLIELLEDLAGLDQSSNYCSSCADGCGKLMSFEEVLENLTQRIAKTDGFDESASRNAALQILGRQPAWEPKFIREEKVKKNKRSMIVVLVTITLVFMTTFITILVTNSQKNFWEQQFDRYSSSYQNPLENMVSYVSNGLEITEFKCKGNQNIEQLHNGILQFYSLEALIRSNKNNKLTIPDKSNYIYNIKTRKAMKIGRYNSYSKKETNDQIMEIRKVIGDNLSELTWYEPCIAIN
ncbi:MAG: hypothetical protein HGA95_05465, partial [Caldiserica bacterium]|nr:hypothetical protein [Caldisericota bacterium]